MYVYGTITIDFSTQTSRAVLLDEFNEFLVKFGVVKLVNMNDQKANLEIHSHEITYVED